jgi:murein DD-endopeptidase MepM/ murein hydrolase activator NlpD
MALRALLPLAVACSVAAPGTALAAGGDTGGATVPAERNLPGLEAQTSPPALTPEVSTPSGGSSADQAPSKKTASPPTNAGAVTFSRNAKRPVARVFTVTPRALREDRVPAISFRIDQPGTKSVNARIVVVPAGTNRAAVAIPLGRVKTGRTIRARWPKGKRLAPGSYDVRLHARDNAGATLARVGGATGKVRLTVVAKPAPTPAPSPAPAPPPSGTTSGVFPVRGQYTINDGFGVDRGDHKHEGQDISAASGTPVVTPLNGTVAFVQYQAGGAGWYVVVDADDGRSLFFAHLKTGSIVVSAGQRVSAGTQLGQVGSTGSSSGPHLHFEIWEGGWRNKGGRPIDPLAQLKAWQ